MTWKEIKLATLNKMFATDGGKIPDDGSADDYIFAMPSAANEALQMLATAGKFLKASYEFEHDPDEAWKYNLKEIVEDFYDIDKIVRDGEQDFIQYNKYRIENDYLVMPNAPKGTYTMFYFAFPEQITSRTPDSYEMPLDPEVVVLLPLYMASQLYKDDDNGIATVYRNEFEVAFERLQNKYGYGTTEFTSESGWI